MRAKRRRIEQLRRRIAQLNAQLHRPDPVAEHFHLGRVGASGANMPRLNRQRERALDRTIDQAVEVGRLQKELRDLEDLVRAEHYRPVREQAEAARIERMRAYVTEAGVGCSVMTKLYGLKEVVRINAKSVTVVIAGGERITVPYDQVLGVIDEGGAA